MSKPKELTLTFKDNIKQQITTLNDSLENQEKVAQEQKDLRIKQITEALKNAEAAKITSPQIQQTQDVTQETMFLLGSEALKSMIDNEASRPLVFSCVLPDQAKLAGYSEPEREPGHRSRLSLRHEAGSSCPS
jgi:LPS O-antigen subunit length determinant protein (WzzB/FepE family)